MVTPFEDFFERIQIKEVVLRTGRQPVTAGLVNSVVVKVVSAADSRDGLRSEVQEGDDAFLVVLVFWDYLRTDNVENRSQKSLSGHIH